MEFTKTWLLPNNYFGIIFIILGAIALVMSYKDFSKFEKMIKTKAKIIDFKKISKYNTLFPIVSFKLPDGKEIVSELNYTNEKLKKDDILNIYYNPNDPEEILSSKTMTFTRNVGCILIILGLIILIANVMVK